MYQSYELMLRKTEFITLKLYEKSFLSFRRSKRLRNLNKKKDFSLRSK